MKLEENILWKPNHTINPILNIDGNMKMLIFRYVTSPLITVCVIKKI